MDGQSGWCGPLEGHRLDQHETGSHARFAAEEGLR